MGGFPSNSNKDDLSVKESNREAEILPEIPAFCSRFSKFRHLYRFEVDGLSSKNISKNQNYGIIPLNILHNIMLFQRLSDLFSMSLSCKLFQTIFNDNHFWKCYFLNIEKLHNKMLGEEKKKEIEELDRNQNWKKKFFDAFFQSNERKKYKRILYDDENSIYNHSVVEDAPRMKISLLGAHLSGKTSFANRFVKGIYDENIISIGAAYLAVTMEYLSINYHEKSKVQLEIWDFRYRYNRNPPPMYYRGSDGVIVFFGIDSLEQFEQAKLWVKELKRNVLYDDGMTFVLVGTKSDLEEEGEEGMNKREVYYKKHIEEYIREEELGYVEVSSKTGKNIHKAIGLTIDCAIRNVRLRRLETISHE